MFHKIKAVNALPDYCLSVQFAEGITKIYDVKPLFSRWSVFKSFENSPDSFFNVEVDVGGYGIIWNDEEIGIYWPLDGIEEIILSDKDKEWKTLKESQIKY